MDVEIFREDRGAGDDALERGEIRGGLRDFAAHGRFVDDGQFLVFQLLGVLLRAGVGVGEAQVDGFSNAVDVFLRDDLFTHQTIGVDRGDAGVRLDLAIHDRLGVAGIVGLVVAVPAVADHVDDDILLKPLAELVGEAGDVGAGFRIVPVDVEDRGVDGAGDIGGVDGAAAVVGAGGEADLVVDDQMDGAAGGVAVELGHVERFGNNTLAGEGGVAVDQQRNDAFALEVTEAILLGTDNAFDNRIDGFQVRRVGREADDDFARGDRTADAGGAQVVLHIAGALRAALGGVAFEFGENLLRLLADDVGENVQAAAVGHADDDFVHGGVGGAFTDFVTDGDGRFATFQTEALGADEAGAKEGFKAFGFVETFENAGPVRGGQRVLIGFHALLEPGFLLRRLDVHVLGADLAAVGLTERFQDFAEREHHVRGAFAQFLAEGAGDEFTVEIPNGEAVMGRIELRMVVRFGAEWIEIGNEVAADSIGVDQLKNAGFFADLHLAHGRLARGNGAIGFPLHRLVRHAQVGKDGVVEVVFTLQQALQLAEEGAAFGTLDDAVIVGTGDRHHLAEAEHGAHFRRDAHEFSREVHGAGGDDAALARHEARDGADRAHGAGIGERKGGALEVRERQLAFAAACDQIVIGLQELGEVHGPGVFDAGHDERTAAVAGRQIDGEAEIDVVAHHLERFAIIFGVGRVQGGDRLQRFHDGPADEVGVGDLGEAEHRAVLVDDAAILVDHLDGDGTLAGGGGNRQREHHVLGDAERSTAQRHELFGRVDVFGAWLAGLYGGFGFCHLLILGGGRGRGGSRGCNGRQRRDRDGRGNRSGRSRGHGRRSRGRGRGSRRGRRNRGHRSGYRGAIRRRFAGKFALPGCVHERMVMQVLLVQFFFQPTVDVDLGAVRHGNVVILGEM